MNKCFRVWVNLPRQKQVFTRFSSPLFLQNGWWSVWKSNLERVQMGGRPHLGNFTRLDHCWLHPIRLVVYLPLWKILVNGKDYPLYFGKLNMFETTNQLSFGFFWRSKTMGQPCWNPGIFMWIFTLAPIQQHLLIYHGCSWDQNRMPLAFDVWLSWFIQSRDLNDSSPKTVCSNPEVPSFEHSTNSETAMLDHSSIFMYFFQFPARWSCFFNT